MGSSLTELGIIVRSLRKQPLFTAAVTVTLALGIGAATSIFSVVNAVLLRPLPYQDDHELVVIWEDLRTRGVVYPVGLASASSGPSWLSPASTAMASRAGGHSRPSPWAGQLTSADIRPEIAPDGCRLAL